MNKHSSVTSVLFSKPFLGILLLFTVVSLLNIPVLITLWRHGFDDGTYSHAFLIPFITLYLYFLLAETGKLQFRKELAIAPSVLLVMSCYLLFVTSNAQISVGYWGALLAVFITSVTMLYRFNWYIVFPAAFLVFIFPFWGILVPILQKISVVAVTYMMSFTGVPTYVEAEIITIPAGVFEIAGGCSGLRYMIVSLAIGSLFIFLNIKDTKKAVLFLSLTILGALLTNWIRITALILIGEYTNMESSLMEDHNTFGWYLYVPFMIFLFKWGNHLADKTLHSNTELNNKGLPPLQLEKKNLLVLVVSLILSSTTYITNNQEITNTLPFLDSTLKPKIYYPSYIENITLSDKPEIEYNIYHFNGADLDGKPSYYDNKFIPKQWQLITRDNISSWSINYIGQQQNKAVVMYRYEINGVFFSELNEFKKSRLINGLTGKNNTSIHWLIMQCEADCLNPIDLLTSTNSINR